MKSRTARKIKLMETVCAVVFPVKEIERPADLVTVFKFEKQTFLISFLITIPDR